MASRTDYLQVSTMTPLIPFVVGAAFSMGGGNQVMTNTMSNDAVRIESSHENALVSALIEKSEDVVGGSARIARTRIPVWTLENFRRLGATPASLLQAFPSLRSVDLDAAWAYVALNTLEIEHDIAENEAA